MEDKIIIDIDCMERMSTTIRQIESALGRLYGNLNGAVLEVHRVASGQSHVIRTLGNVQRNLSVTENDANRFSETLRKAAQLWRETEREIAKKRIDESQSPFDNITDPSDVSNTGNPVFNTDVSQKKFGGDQGSPRSDVQNYNTFRDIIEENTGIRLNNKALKIYLERLNSEGCGYVAMINAIFTAYVGHPDAFRETFGYDMYDSQGNPNFNLLLVDLYSSTDNRNVDGSENRYEDYGGFGEDGFKWFYNPWKDISGEGTSIGEREDKMQMFLDDHGVACDVTTEASRHLSAAEYNQLVNSGAVSQGELHIRLSGNPVVLRDADGNPVDSYSGGHAMTVTGTTESGLLQVSSWGEIYYIDPDALGTNTSMGYQIVHIHV